MSSIIGERIKKIRNLRGMTQKQFAEAIGLPVESGDVRIAQYENGSRKAKSSLTKKMAEVLGVDTLAISEPKIDNEHQVLHFLFMLEDRYGLKIQTNMYDGEPCLTFNNRELERMLRDWYMMNEQCIEGCISQEEYDNWRYQFGGQITDRRDEDEMGYVQSAEQPHLGKSSRADYPMNLLRDIPINLTEVTADQRKGIEFVLTQLTEREQLILAKRYQEGLSYAKIGTIYDLTGSRVEQIMNRTLRRLCHSSRKAYIIEGFDAHETAIREHITILKEAKYKHLNAYKDRLLEQDIDLLDLAVRPYNVLKMKGVNTISDLLELLKEQEWYKECRNLGIKGATAIVESLLKLGIVDEQYPGCGDFTDRVSKNLFFTEKEWDEILIKIK